ncbi:Gp15 family bacteriophage protein [Ruminococcus flavefaciens]|uniref:Gp15 family bacteriophage protein n=1 Tax=Ruminococcus flavefaciens TaxID=1265 RepID=UPI0026EA8E66|nr:Gp15 family bacteriophage protein [Ruminococcus flavefaciens]
MINALYEPFPECITVDGQEYQLLTDFREWIRFADMIHDTEIDNHEKVCMLALWFIDVPHKMTAEMVDALFDFYYAKDLEPDADADEDDEKTVEDTVIKPPVFDWRIDSRYILGDFRHYYGIDLISIEYLHWWEFRCLFAALPDDSQCQKRMAYRSIDLGSIKSDQERNRIARIQRSIAIPYECEDDMIAAAFGGLI